MLAKLGCHYVLVGHSERRQHYGETDELVNAKARMALAHGLTPIVCVGEGIEVREEMDQVEFTIALVSQALANLTLDQIGSLVVAYEPVWAIGTGRVATPDDAEEVCGSIREWIGQWYDRGVAERVRILYGGSVKANNVVEIMAQTDVDGCLVGGASLMVDEFAAIARFYDLPTL
jgi:triosephosphate isomerase